VKILKETPVGLVQRKFILYM